MVNLRTKLILVLSFVLIIAFASTSLISYLVSRDQFRSSTLEETLPLITHNILSEVQRDLMMPVHVSSLMSNDTLLKDWAEAGETDTEQIARYLREIRDQYGFFTAFFISDRTGNYYYYDGLLKTISPEDSHDAWYYHFKEKNVELDLDVDTDEASAGTLTIFINHRLLDYAGGFLGVAGVGLNMDQVGKLLVEYQAQYRRRVYLTDSTGLIQIHPDRSLIEKMSLADIEGLGRLAPEILRGKADSESFEFERDGRRVFLATSYVPMFDWFLIVEQEEGQQLSDIRSVLATNLAVGLAVTVLIIVIVVLAVNHFQGRLEFMATVDDLTQVVNRRRFMEILKAEAVRSVRYGHTLSLLMIDADHFKAVNDAYGHPVGDKALTMLAEVIRNSLRVSDVPGRVGGEEFAALLPETDLDEALLVAERIRADVEARTIESEKGPLRLTVSLGAASAAPESLDREDLLRRADEALYLAKENGRNRVEKNG